MGYKARGHGRVEARVNWGEKSHHELECRMGTEFVGLFLHVVLNGTLGFCRRDIWSNTNWQAATQWQHSGSEAIQTALYTGTSTNTHSHRNRKYGDRYF